MSKNNYYEDRYISPEEIQEYVLEKFKEAHNNHGHYHEFWIDQDGIGYSREGSSQLGRVENAIIVLKYGTDVVNVRMADGKVVGGDNPDDLYLVYRPRKFLVCAQYLKGNETFMKFKSDEAFAIDFDITVFILIQHETGVFCLLYTPETARFSEPYIVLENDETAAFMGSIRRFFHLPSNFRSLPKDTEESEDDE